jgi:hypothetical protein
MSRPSGAATERSRDQAGADPQVIRFASGDNCTFANSHPAGSRLLAAPLESFGARPRWRVSWCLVSQQS